MHEVRNLVVNGSFELGLGAEPLYAGCTAHPGMGGYHWVPLPEIDRTQARTGRASLRLHGSAATRARLEVQGRMLAPGKRYRVSFWAKASRPGVSVRVMGRTEGYGTFLSAGVTEWGHAAIPLSTEWQRFDVEGEAPDKPLFGTVTVEFVDPQGGEDEAPFSLWVDDVVWTEGGEPAGAFVPSSPVEVVLLPRRRESRYHAGETYVADCRVLSYDGRQRRRLRVSLRDVGRQKNVRTWEEDVAAGPGRPIRRRVDFGRLPRGAYIAEAHLLDPDTGAALCRSRERFCVLSRLAKGAGNGPWLGIEHSSFFTYEDQWAPGTGFMGSWRGAWTLDELFGLFTDVGFGVQRAVVSWWRTEPSEGVYDWRVTDALMGAAKRHGCRVIACLGTPVVEQKVLERIRSEGEGSVPGGWAIARSRPVADWERTDLTKGNAVLLPPEKEWARFVLAFVRRYRGTLAAIEVLNEVDLSFLPEDYIRGWLQPVYGQAKGAAPEVAVLANPLCDVGIYRAKTESERAYLRDRAYLGRFLKAGGLDWCDGISFHAYTAPLLEHGGRGAMEGLQWLLRELAPGKQPVLAMTELHHPHPEVPNAYHLVGYDLVQRTLLDWLYGVPYSAGVLFDFTLFREVSWHVMYARQSRVPGPAAVVANALRALTAGHRLAGRLDLDPGVLCARFEPAGGAGSLAILCAADRAGQQARLQVDLQGVKVTAYDPFGEAMPLVPRDGEGRMILPREPLYLASDSPLLLERFRRGRVTWEPRSGGEKESDYSPGQLVEYETPGRGEW